MKKFFLTILPIVFFLLVVNIDTYSQGQNTTQGKDFWVSFGKNFNDANVLQVRIVASKKTTATFTYTQSGTTYSVEIQAGEVYTRLLTDQEKGYVYSNVTGSSNKSLRIETTEPVSVFAISLTVATTDATNVLPVTNLGTAYYHLSYKALGGYLDGYTIVATEDNTVIAEDGVNVATLNRGGVYSAYYLSGDITGKYITSNNPIAYFATNSCVNIPVGHAACDCLFQQIVPVNSWGNNFLVPVTKRGVERVRVVASQDGTVIQQTGGTLVTDIGTGSYNLNKGQFVELEASLVNNGCYIHSDKPIAVGSFLTGTAYPKLTYSLGDPAFAWVPPIEQTVASVAIAPFIAAGSSILTEHHALLVTADATKDQTTMSIGAGNPQPLSGGTWYVNTASGYSFYSIPLTSVSSTYFFENPNGLTIMGYGLGSAESYYYLAAASARTLDAAFYVNDTHFEDINGQMFCDKSYNFKAVIQYAMSTTSGYLRWYINGIEEVAAKDKKEWSKTLTPGTYTIEMVVIDLYNEPHTLTTTFTVISDPAAPTIKPANAVICPPATNIMLSASGGGNTYQWYLNNNPIIGATQGTYFASDAGNYTVTSSFGACSTPFSAPVTVSKGTPATESMIIINDMIVCNGSSAQLLAQAPSVNNPVFKWYESPMATNPIFIGNPFITPPVTSPMGYFVSVEGSNYCENLASSRKLAKINVGNTIDPGTISGQSQVCPNTSPGQLSGTPPSGGSGNYFYTWQKSSDGTNWTDIPNSNTQNLDPGVIASTTYFRRIIKDMQCGEAISAVFTVKVVPPIMYWSMNASDKNWNNVKNWDDESGNPLNAVPMSCTSVHIPGNSKTNNYPSLDVANTPRTGFGEPVCDNIIFHFGAEVAKPHLLTYNKATIQYNFGYFNNNTYMTDGDKFSAPTMKRGQWYALAAPLKKIVSGDFSVGGFPNMWQKGFHTTSGHTGSLDQLGEWYVPENTLALEIGAQQNYAISIWGAEYLPGTLGENDHKDMNTLKGIFEMPFFDNTTATASHRNYSRNGNQCSFQYYEDQKVNLPLANKFDYVTRGNEAHRFIFEDANNKPQANFKVTVPAGDEIMIGNPVLSSLDFTAFYNANSTNIQPYYRLYENGSFNTYSIATQNAYPIASFQAFFIKTNGTKGQTVDLYFPIDNVSITRTGAHQLKAAKASEGKNNSITIEAKNLKGANRVVLALNGSSNTNITQMFMNDQQGKQSPQLYLVDNTGQKNSVQFEPDYNTEIPISFKCEANGEINLSFDLSQCDAETVTLKDNLADEQKNLYKNNSYSFQYVPGQTNERFTLVIGQKAPTSIFDVNSKFNVYAANNTIYINSDEVIADIHISNAQGLKVLSKTAVGKNHLAEKINYSSGVYIVTVKLVNGDTQTRKVIIE